MHFRQGDVDCCRYDADLMIPANEASVYVHSLLKKLVSDSVDEGITWSGDRAVVISNWTTLHGRGPQPEMKDLV